jgi:hypothetical protein
MVWAKWSDWALAAGLMVIFGAIPSYGFGVILNKVLWNQWTQPRLTPAHHIASIVAGMALGWLPQIAAFFVICGATRMAFTQAETGNTSVSEIFNLPGIWRRLVPISIAWRLCIGLFSLAVYLATRSLVAEYIASCLTGPLTILILPAVTAGSQPVDAVRFSLVQGGRYYVLIGVATVTAALLAVTGEILLCVGLLVTINILAIVPALIYRALALAQLRLVEPQSSRTDA